MITLDSGIAAAYLYCFRGDGRSRAQAAMDIVLQRAIAWSLATAYFIGLAITSRDFLYLFVEAGQAISTWTREML